MSNISDYANFPFTDADLVLDCNVFRDDELNEWSKEHREDNMEIIKIPKIPKNDIRRYFPSMFMNTCNSGDFHHIQSFLQTFMTNNCNCISTQKLPLTLKIPDLVVAEGPVLFAHYLLGLQMMCPDVTMRLKNSKVVTFSNSSVTKIIMDVECSLTKIAHIPYELWIPSPDMLSRLYTCSSLKNLYTTTSGTYNNSSTSNDSTNRTTNDNIRKRKNHTDINENDHNNSGNTTTATNSHNTTTTNNNINNNNNNKNNNTANNSHNTATNNSITTAATYIPESYMYKLTEVATLLPSPLSLNVHAQLVIVMDQRKHIIAVNFHIDPI